MNLREAKQILNESGKEFPIEPVDTVYNSTLEQEDSTL